MNVALWAEIRRLAEIEKLSGRLIARRLHCSRHTVAAALESAQPPAAEPARRVSLLDPYLDQIKDLLTRHPDLSAVRIREEIARGPQGYRGSATVLRRYLRHVRPARGRVYQEVPYQPAQAMQVDWGECGRVQVGATTRKVSVFVAVLCYSRLLFIEFTLSQRKAEFYRSLVNALIFFGGSPRNVIFDNLKAAVLNGSGRSACYHPEFLALCGYFCLQPVACARYDPESKGLVEGGVRYVKHNALAGRADQLLRFEDYLALAPAGATRWPTCAGTRPPTSGRSIASSRSGRCCGRCPLSPSTPTKSCRPSSARMPALPSTVIAIPCRRSSCADPLPFAPTTPSCACCTKARWWRSMFAVMSADRCWCCWSTAWQR